MRCPKCQTEQADGRKECGACGVVFGKARLAGRAARPASTVSATRRRLSNRIWERLFPEGPAISQLPLGFQVAIFLAAGLWGTAFIARGFGAASDSVLHYVHLPFHEAGHVLFMPFGRFVMTLAGSFMQLAIPLVCLATLLIKARDAFGASLALFWTGHSLMDLAPYIADARALELVLLGGHTGAEAEGHDWEYLLGALGLLEYDRLLGRMAHGFGVALILLALAWGGTVLWRQVPRIRERRGAAS
jgi:hypothetical protein